MDTDDRQRKSTLAVNLGLAANVLLAALKTSIGILGHSPALLADGINSTSDVAYYVVVSVFIRLARKSPDEEHPLGHSQLESIAALIVGSFVVTTAVAVFWGSVNNVYELLVGEVEASGATASALWVGLLTILSKLALTAYTRRLGGETQNAAVLALAYDHRNDVFSALAAVVGIAVGRMGVLWVDPLAGALVALVILRTGIEILRDSSADLMDAVPSRMLEQQVRALLGAIPEVRTVEQIYAHRFGAYLILNLTIGIDGSLTVVQGDRIASAAERTLYENIEFLRYVNVHCHPAPG